MNSSFCDFDNVTDCKNILAFAKLVISLCSKSHDSPFALVIVDINSMSQINRQKGFPEGDRILRWLGSLLREELQTTIYRLGHDEFVAILAGEGQDEINKRTYSVFEKINDQAQNLSLPTPFASIAAIHLRGDEKLIPEDVYSYIFHAIGLVKEFGNHAIQIFAQNELVTENSFRSPGWLAYPLVERLIYLEQKLEELAYTDDITNLPNQRSAQIQFDKLISKASLENKPFAVLLMDGDNLHRYNEISYQAGDEMIHRLGRVIQDSIRPVDFAARWRVGDEFLVLIDDIGENQGVFISERIRRTVEETSQQWRIPITISGGLATFPKHGHTPDELIRAAELANQFSKRNGKNRITLYRSELKKGGL